MIFLDMIVDVVLIAVLMAVVVMQVILLTKRQKTDNSEIINRVDTMERRVHQEQSEARKEANDSQKETIKLFMQQQNELLKTNSDAQDKIYRTLNSQSEKLNTTLTDVVGKLQESNEKKLDQMRETVDEKLTKTLTDRLDSSFKTVGDQLQNVYKSLGEMKELASGVNDLQRVLTNVKARGTWAEVQLGNLLEQTLTNEQYERNVSINNNGKFVEFAVKIPSRDTDGSYVWLPIDSKFPQEDYIRLSDAAQKADKEGVEEASKALKARILKQAKDISSLYISVPKTTDFAIMFLPTEGLYAEVLRMPGLAEEVQNKYRIMICGPTTITAFLNTLRMGFRTIALDKRAAEVWKVLGAAKTQYEKFELILAKTKKKIDEAGNTIEDAAFRNRQIMKKLKGVEEIEASQADNILSLLESDESETEPQ